MAKKAVKVKNKVKSADSKKEKLFKKTKKLGDMDYAFLLLTVVLTIIGLVMLLSASTPTANVQKDGNSYYFFKRQGGYVLVGIIAMIICSRIDYKKYKKFANIAILGGIVLLILVLIPGIGASINGSRRWLKIGPMNFQPSELVKFLVAVFFASLVEEKRYDITTIKGLLKYAAWILAIILPIAFETHLSGAIVIAGIAVCILIVGGAGMKYIITGGIGAAGAVVGIAIFMPSRASRLISFLHPFKYTQDEGYQMIQSLYAIGSGGVFGRGLGQSVQKYAFLPEPYNDFIFSVICEELGLVGAVFIMLIFALLIMRGFLIAANAEDKFGTLLATGIMSQVAIQTVLNIAVVTSSLPNTGVTLPFFSYGGTAVMMLLAEMGVMLNISRSRRKSD